MCNVRALNVLRVLHDTHSQTPTLYLHSIKRLEIKMATQCVSCDAENKYLNITLILVFNA